jgi:hypothetical protein
VALIIRAPIAAVPQVGSMVVQYGPGPTPCVGAAGVILTAKLQAQQRFPLQWQSSLMLTSFFNQRQQRVS